MKKYHTFNLILGIGDHGDEWAFERIGTEREKMHVEKELQELRERLAQVDEWKMRRAEIEAELNQVWTEGGEVLEETFVDAHDGSEEEKVEVEEIEDVERNEVEEIQG